MFALLLPALSAAGLAQNSSSSSSSAKPARRPPAPADSEIDSGAVNNGLYRNRSLAFTCRIPEGWVLRTDEMNTRQPDESPTAEKPARPAPTPGSGCPQACGKVLLAAFSRPPEARGEDVNASLVIAAEPVAAYPGLKEAAQYFGPLTEVAKAQGFAPDEDPYELTVGSKVLVRGDFHKNVGSRVMRQSTLAMLARGYAVSITVIGGTEDEVDQLIDGLDFEPAKATKQPRQ
jgi:hypothetical protein